MVLQQRTEIYIKKVIFIPFSFAWNSYSNKQLKSLEILLHLAFGEEKRNGENLWFWYTFNLLAPDSLWANEKCLSLNNIYELVLMLLLLLLLQQFEDIVLKMKMEIYFSFFYEKTRWNIKLYVYPSFVTF